MVQVFINQNKIKSPSMTQEINMSVTHYFRIKEKLVPKHVGLSQHQRKKIAYKKLMLLETPAETIQKAKEKYLKPIKDIETIMKHFNSKFTDKKVDPRQVKRKPRTKTSYDEYEVDKKIKHILELPTLKGLQHRAQSYRKILNQQQHIQREQKKSKILENFQDYMKAQLQTNPVKISSNKRQKTSY